MRSNSLASLSIAFCSSEELQRIQLSHLLHLHSLAVKSLFHNQVNMLPMVLRDKLPGRSLVDRLLHNGILAKFHQLFHLQRPKL